ncbi:MAG: hypothetical protein ABW133_08960 [Polyangiaceae bacterium]
MGTRPHLWAAVLRNVVVVALPLAGCSVFEPPPMRQDGGGGAGAGDTGAPSEAGPDASIDRSDVDVSSDRTVNADTDSSAPEDSPGRDADARDETVADANAADSADAPEVDTGTDTGRDGGPTGPWWPYTNTHGCTSAGVPVRTDRPAASDTGADLPPIYLAVSRLRAGTTKDDGPLTPDDNAWQDIGFDFDKLCTRSATCEVDQMQVNDKSCANSNLTPFDGNQCRDNEIGKLLKVASTSPTVGDYFGMTERDWNCEIHRGGFTILFKISGYNGRPNDRDVRLDMYTSTGLQSLPVWTCRATIDQPLSADWYNRATWLPSDRWKVAQRSIDPAAVQPTDPNELKNGIAADVAAFVRNGYIYAELPEGAEFWLNGENTAVPGTRQIMHRAVLVGQLIKGQDDLWTIDHGILQFVTSPGEMLGSFQEIGYCENMCESYYQLRNYLNTHQDTLTGTSEHLPATPCNGLSVAFDYKARQATARAQDVVPVQAPTSCPQPRHPAAPRQGTQCDGGPAGDAATDAAIDGGSDGSTDVTSVDSAADNTSQDTGGN